MRPNTMFDIVIGGLATELSSPRKNTKVPRKEKLGLSKNTPSKNFIKGRP